mgnify:CR=1 FL=1
MLVHQAPPLLAAQGAEEAVGLRAGRLGASLAEPGDEGRQPLTLGLDVAGLSGRDEIRIRWGIAPERRLSQQAAADERRHDLAEQRLLPGEERHERYDDPAEVAKAIKDMVVRGAPAIGIAAAFGMALAARRAMPLPPRVSPVS